MDKFTKTLRGYDPEQVNAFLDQVIEQVEKMAKESKEKDLILKRQQEKINELEKNSNNEELIEKLKRYENMESTLNRAIIMAEKTSEQIKITATRESELIIDNAKQNANRLVNDALIKADNTEREAAQLKRNINLFKRRLRDIIETQLEMVNDIEKIDF